MSIPELFCCTCGHTKGERRRLVRAERKRTQDFVPSYTESLRGGCCYLSFYSEETQCQGHIQNTQDAFKNISVDISPQLVLQHWSQHSAVLPSGTQILQVSFYSQVAAAVSALLMTVCITSQSMGFQIYIYCSSRVVHKPHHLKILIK